MIDIDSTHSVDHKNGYYNVRVFGIVKSGKDKGDRKQSYMKTYADIFGAWDRLKELGVESNKALASLEKAKDADVVVISNKELEKRASQLISGSES
jgi:hypothetical protein